MLIKRSCILKEIKPMLTATTDCSAEPVGLSIKTSTTLKQKVIVNSPSVLKGNELINMPNEFSKAQTIYTSNIYIYIPNNDKGKFNKYDLKK